MDINTTATKDSPAVDAEAQFAANLRRLRAERGLTQEALGERADLGFDYIAKIENELRSPGVKIIAKLAKGLDVDPGQLFEDVEP